MALNTEGGLRPSRIEFIEEDGNKNIPTDPTYKTVSDRVTEFEPAFGPEAVDKPGIGDFDAEIAAGLEENELTLTYDLQRWLKDSNGNPDDLSAYGLLRTPTGHMPGTLAIVERTSSYTSGGGGERDEVESSVHYNYIGDGTATARHRHMYTVARGAKVDEITLTGEPGEVYWAAEATIMCQTGRSYQLDQPEVVNPLNIEAVPHGNLTGSNSADTGLTVVLESDDGTTIESIQLDGTDASTTITTTSDFASIDSVRVTDGAGNNVDHFGDVLIYETSGSDTDGDGTIDTYNNEQLLGVLYGNSYYGNTHGDYGVPGIDSNGAHGGEIGSTRVGTDFYAVGNSLAERPIGQPFEAAGSVNTIELSVENDSANSPENRSRENRYHPQIRSTELTLTCDGETVSHRAMQQAASLENIDTALIFDRAGNLQVQLPGAPMGETTRTRSAGENALEMEFVVRSGGEGVTATTPP